MVEALRGARRRQVTPVTDNDARRIEDKVDGVALAVARLEGMLTPTLDKINARQDDIEGSVEDLEQKVDERHADHEGRLRSLERFRYSIPSLAVLSLILSAAMLVYYVTK